MDDGTYKLYDLRVEELLEECNQAHLEFDYWLRWSYAALATLWAFVVGIWVSWFFDWPLPIRNVIAGLTIIAVLVVWSLQIPRAAALSRAERAIAEADALIKWMDRQLEKEIDS